MPDDWGEFEPMHDWREQTRKADFSNMGIWPPEDIMRQANGKASSNIEAEPLSFMDLAQFDDRPVPAREWAVRDHIPARNVTLQSGEGAAGKTIVLMQLGVAHALGRDWLGMMPEPGPFVYLGAEDDADELHRRLADILRHYEARFSDIRDRVHILSLAGEDAVLGHADRSGIVKPTPLFDRLHKAALDIQPKLIGLDTASDVFAGNENDRAQVRQFVGLLRRLAIDANAAVIANSHPSLTGINSGTGLSGSTGWHNSVRARMYLTTAKTEQDEEPDPDLRMLEFKKNNYGPVGDRIMIRWQNGVYVPVPGTGSLDKMAAEHKADDVFLALLDRFNQQGRNVNDKAGTSYAPALFAKEKEAKTAGIRKEALAAAMSRLFNADKIHLEPFGYASRGTFRLVKGAK